MAQQSMKKLLLSVSIAAALATVSGTAFADGDSVEELEARVAELEALVQQLLNRPPPASGPTAAEVDARAEAIAEEKVNTVLAEHRAMEAEQEHKHSYAFGGYVKLDMMYSDYDASYEGLGRDYYVPFTIPLSDGSGGETYFDAHVKESRINFKSTHNLDNGAKLGTFLEMDFHNSAQGNEIISNSWSPRIRHAFFTYNNWLVGQTWWTFFNVGALPENLDFIGPAESTVFGRQPMIRYTNGPWQFAVENPETSVRGYEGNGRNARTGDNRIPDLVARYNMKGDWGAITVAGILRELRCDGCLAGVDDSTTGYGVSVSGKHMIGSQDDFRWMATAGSGLGRYLGTFLTDAAVVDASGNLKAIDSWGAFASYRHFWNANWRSNLTLGYASVDNDVSLTGEGVTSDAYSGHVNLIYSPQPKLDFGLELMYANREIESGLDGSLTRLQFSAKYAY